MAPFDDLGKKDKATLSDVERIALVAILKFSTSAYRDLTFQEIWDRLLVEYQEWQELCEATR